MSSHTRKLTETIRMIKGRIPYLGVLVEDEFEADKDRWHPLNDKDLWRLEKAVKKCREAIKKRK